LKNARLPVPKTTFPSGPSKGRLQRAAPRGPTARPSKSSAHLDQLGRRMTVHPGRPRALPPAQPANPARLPASPLVQSRSGKSPLGPNLLAPSRSEPSRTTGAMRKPAPTRPSRNPQARIGQDRQQAGPTVSDHPHLALSLVNPPKVAVSPRSQPGRSPKASSGRRTSARLLPVPRRHVVSQHTSTTI